MGFDQKQQPRGSKPLSKMAAKDEKSAIFNADLGQKTPKKRPRGRWPRKRAKLTLASASEKPKQGQA
jgi:hypothetical protein